MDLSRGSSTLINGEDGAEPPGHLDTPRVSLYADKLTVIATDGATLLDEVSFGLGPDSLLAVVGPSGAGKSTLLGALTGVHPANRGTVCHDGRDLYAEYDNLRHRVGLVPQDDILHSRLTVRRALSYAADLRFGPGVTDTDRDSRIDEVLGQLGLAPHADQRIDTLSGGERKRTSVALELLTEPSLLFLDEPTSGLDPALDRDVMVSLRELAHRGRTVVVVTHSPLHLDLCDQVLVLGCGGKVTYLGPPEHLLRFFSADGYADVFRAVASDPDSWAARHAAATATTPPQRSDAATVPPRPRHGRCRQLRILTRRTVRVMLADSLCAGLSLALALGLALLMHAVPGSDGLAGTYTGSARSGEATELLVILIVGATFLGLASGIRELMHENAIYRRERAIGLSPGAYLGSKLLIFGARNAVQATVFVVLGLAGRPGPRYALVLGWPLLELIAAVWLTALTATALGLLISTFLTTGEQAMPVLVGLVMAQLVLCGGLFGVVERGIIEELSWLAPSRWGYAAAAATVDLRSVARAPAADALWRHTTGAWLWAMGVLALQAIALTAATRVALRRHEPGRLPGTGGVSYAARRHRRPAATLEG